MSTNKPGEPGGPDDRFGAELGAELRDRADRTPTPAGLVSASLGRARQLRRRQFTTVGAIAAAVVIIAGGVGLGSRLAPDTGPTEPRVAATGSPTVATTGPAPTPTPQPATPSTLASSETPPPPPSTTATSAPESPAIPPPAPPTTPSEPPRTSEPPRSRQAPGPCTYDNTSVAVTAAGGAAGSMVFNVTVANRGTESCTVQGFPGVSLVTGDDGTQLGAAAAREDVAPAQLTIPPGGSAAAQLLVARAENHGEECRLTPARGFRIYLPGERRANFVSWELNGCANEDIVLLRIRPFA
ncbi:DUF4232 domain-containing protein [Microlunatus sp. Y2014]|uniref:DUF4232 domain-containing protein n=1 Tax=Microlunatus sp. Y2014 TaxID=3418488 RepID=UPI003DA77F8B